MSTRYSRVEAYLAQLPHGLDSFPECQAKASIHRKIYELSESPLSGLPERLQSILDSPPPPSAMLSQCESLALVLAMIEARGLARDKERLWVREASTHLFASPMYQILMWAVSPRMVFKSANMRWSAFFRGSKLSSEVGEREARVTLHAPRGLFHLDLATIFTDVIHAAVNYTRDEAGSATVELAKVEPSGIEYRGRW